MGIGVRDQCQGTIPAFSRRGWVKPQKSYKRIGGKVLLSYPYVQLIKHYAMKRYVGVDI
jgi:hypothetical protein